MKETDDPPEEEDTVVVDVGERTVATRQIGGWSKNDMAETKRRIARGVPLDGADKSASRSNKSLPQKDSSSSSSSSKLPIDRNEGSNSISNSTATNMSIVEAKRHIHNKRAVQNTSSKEEEIEVQNRQSCASHSQPGAHGSEPIGNHNQENPMHEVVAEVVEEPVMADIVDDTSKRRKTVAIVVVACVAIASIAVGVVCGSGGCRSGVGTSLVEAEETECNLYVTSTVAVVTDTMRRLNALSRSPLRWCEPRNPEVDPWPVDCPLPLFDCFEPPYWIQMSFNGGNCADNKEETELDTLSCQDGPTKTPPQDFGVTAYIRVTDLLKDGVTYFDDYVKIGDFFSLYNKGSEIGPDILIQIFESDEPDAEILQTVYYYSVCSNKLEYLSRFGAVQVWEFLFDSQTLAISNDTESIQLMVSAKGPLKLLDDGTEASPQITVDKIELFPSYAQPSEQTGVYEPIDKTLFGDGVLLTTEDLPVKWVANKTERISLRAEVTSTGPEGETCTGTGLLNFRIQHV